MLIKWLYKLFGGRVRLITLDQEKERTILFKMSQIEGINDYFELQKQGAYQLHGRTKDERHLGIVDFCQTLLALFEQINQPPAPEEKQGNGYEST